MNISKVSKLSMYNSPKFWYILQPIFLGEAIYNQVYEKGLWYQEIIYSFASTDRVWAVLFHGVKNY